MDPLPIIRANAIGPEGPTFSAYLRAKVAPPTCPTFDTLKPLSRPGVSTSLSPKRPSSSQSSARPTASKATSQPAVAGASVAAASTSYASTSRLTQAQPARPTTRRSSPDIIEIDEGPQLSLREKMLRAAEARTAEQGSSARPSKLDIKGKGKAQGVLPNAFDVMQAAAAAASASTWKVDPAGPAVQMTASSDGHFVPDVDALVCEVWRPGEYTIHLVIDNREKPGLSNKKLEDMLTAKDIPWKAGTLAMGDAIWVAKSKSTGTEVVLDACLERKRLDDLLSSMRGMSCQFS